MKKVNIDINHGSFLDKNYLKEILLGVDSEITINFISDFKSSKLLRNFISNLSDILNIDSIWKSRLILIIDELSNNSIEYGSSLGELNWVKISINYTSDEFVLNCEVTDTGNGVKPKKASEMYDLKNFRKQELLNNHNSIRGRGLFIIIDKLVDELYFKDSNKGGLIVGVNKKFKRKK